MLHSHSNTHPHDAGAHFTRYAPSKRKVLTVAKNNNSSSSTISEKTSDETVEFWSRKTGKPVTREEAREMVENIIGFFEVLDEWDKRDKMIDEGGAS